MTRRLPAALAASALVLAASAGLWRAATAAPPPSREGQVEAVAATLRCPTCQGLSVADSPSKVAESMRGIIGEQLDAGRTPDAVREWFVGRYGEWILLSPIPSGLGWLVWLLPIAAVAGGVLGVVALVRRRGPTGPATAVDPAEVEQALARWTAGALDTPPTPAGERMEASLLLLSEVRADRATGAATPRAEALAAARVADALVDADPEAWEPQSAPARLSPPRSLPVRLRWAAGVAAFLLVLTGFLAVSVRPRATGQVPTGDLPTLAAAAPEEDARLDELRAAAEADHGDADAGLALARGLADAGRLDEAVTAYRDVLARNPSNARTRLLLAGTLLRAGDPASAGAEAEAVLAAAPDDPDALLLLGIAQAEQGDGTAAASLRRYLDVAPAGHPGREVAAALLEEAGG